MITTFHGGETGLKLSIENYDVRKINVRYKAVINDDQAAVLHLQTVDTEGTPDLSQLSLCPGVLESKVQDTVSELLINNLGNIIIEKVEDNVVFRSRSCLLLSDHEKAGICESCKLLFNDLKIDLTHFKTETAILEEEKDGMDYDLVSENGSDVARQADSDVDFDQEGTKAEPTVIRIMKRGISETQNDTANKKKRQYKLEGVHYYCDQCEFKATSKVGIRQHVKNKHEGVSYPCNQCSKQFTTVTELKYHIRSKHEGVLHSCDQCDFQARTKAGVRQHVKNKQNN